jgi:uroporphyrin-3 C-methyltransferase
MNQDTPSGRDPEGRPTEKTGDDAPATGGPEPSASETAHPADPFLDGAGPDDETRDDRPGREPSPQVIEHTVEVRRGGALAALAFLLALAALGGAGYLWWLQQQPAGADPETAALAQRQSDLGTRLSTLEDRIGAIEARAERPVAEPDAALQAAVDANRERSARMEDQLAELDERIARLAAMPVQPAGTTDEPGIMPPEPPVVDPAWRRAEVELLLRVAQRQAALAGDTEASAAALAEADRAIEALDDPRLAPVRRQIADDLLALRAVARPDLDGIAFRLGSLQARVANLPVREGAARGEAPAESAAEADDGGLDRLERKSREFLSGLVRVRDSSSDDRVFHTPAETWFLRRNLELELQAARVAILTENPGAYRDSLAKARRWADAYFEPGDPGVQAFVSALDELSAQAIDVEIPDVSGSLQVYLETAAVE